MMSAASEPEELPVAVAAACARGILRPSNMEMLPRLEPDNFVISEPVPAEENGCLLTTVSLRFLRQMYEQPRPSSSSDRNKMAHMMRRMWNPFSGGSTTDTGGTGSKLQIQMADLGIGS
jgi:hypothetical protein